MTDRHQAEDHCGPNIHRLQDVPPAHRPSLPRNIDWSAYVDYNCRIRQCQDSCLNRADSPYAQQKLCRACYPAVDTEDLPSKILHLPAWAHGLEVGDTPATSEGEGEGTPGSATRAELVAAARAAKRAGSPYSRSEW